MFDENNTLVTEEVTENVEQQTTEENVEGTEVEEGVEDTLGATEEPKMYSEAELEEIKTTIKLNAKKNAERKIRKEYENKYGKLESVLKAGTGVDSIEEMTDTFNGFYTEQFKKKGLKFEPNQPVYGERETEILAQAEADDIIAAGYDELVEEVDRLAEIGVENMTSRDKIIFSKLAKERQRVEDEKALATLGIGQSAINDAEFKDFSKKLNPNLSLKEKYEMYLQVKPKKKIEPMGSMKSGPTSKVKDFYTAEEIARLTDEDLDNPQIWEAVRKSMTGQA